MNGVPIGRLLHAAMTAGASIAIVLVAYAAPSVGAAPQRASRTLLDSYVFDDPQPVMAGVTYRPWQYATTYNGSGFTVTDRTHGDYQVSSGGAYKGWDALLLPNDGYFRASTDPNWLRISLTRGATLGVVWKSNSAQLPAWLSGWSLSPNASPDYFCGAAGCPVYTKVFAGPQTVTLGGVRASNDPWPRDVYYVLLGEMTGLPSAAPAQLGSPSANANQTCPGWVHDQYTTMGPDGRSYPTWHPQIDPVYWCYFRHEHGSDPTLFSPGYRPVFGYTASAMAEDEPHAGFKTQVFDDGQDHRWLITQHFGTGSLARACARYHTLDIAAETASTRQLLADLHFMADFGASTSNATGQPLTPAACPDQALGPAHDGSTGVRELPVATQGPTMYEPWRFDGRGNILGLIGTVTFNTRDGLVICDRAPSCAQPIGTGGSGSYHFFMYNRDFAIRAGNNTGRFYTDPLAHTLMNQPHVANGQAMQPVQQYVRAGVSIAPPYPGDSAACFTRDPWRAMYTCSLPPFSAFPLDLEGGLASPN